MNIFLVEDSRIVHQRLLGMLASVPGAHVAGHATGATEAIRAIGKSRPDIVVLDISLAQGTGFDVLRALRVQAPETKVFMLSNFATEPYRRLAADLGAQDFFDKSTEIDALRTALASRASGTN